MGLRIAKETTDFMTTTTKATTTEKTYSEAQEAILTQAAINAGGKIDGALAETLAIELGKDVRSIRAKAARMGIYKAAEKKSKSGLPIETKEDIALAIAAIVGTNLDGLEKASKRTLQILREKLQA